MAESEEELNSLLMKLKEVSEKLMAITNSSRKNEAAGPKQKQLSVLDVSGGESKVQ